MKRIQIADKTYRWIVISVCFLMVFITLGFCSSTRSLYLAAITDATGIKRSLFSISDSCRFITTAVVNLFFGSILARYGAKKMIAGGFCSLILFALIYAHAESAWQFCVGGCFLGLGLSFTTTTMIGHVVNVWCREHRGTIMRIVLSANGVGAALATQIVSPMINENAFGYRSAYMLIILLLAITAIIVLVFFREYPRESTDHTEGLRKKKARGSVWGGISYEQALRVPYFYAAAVCIFLTGMTLQGVSGVAAAHMKDVGLDPQYIAAVLSIHSLALSAFKMLVGMMYDKLGLRKTLFICNFAAVLSIVLLVSVMPAALGKLLALAYGILCALAMPLETIMLPLITADLFGEHSYEKMLGIYVSVNVAGYALGVPLTNLSYDYLGSYNYALMILCVIMLAVTLSYAYILNAVSKKRRQVEQAMQ